jgi:hypothetical protein
MAMEEGSSRIDAKDSEPCILFTGGFSLGDMLWRNGFF